MSIILESPSYYHRGTEQKLRMHARKLVALSLPSSMQQIPKLGSTPYFLPRAFNFNSSFQKAYIFNHFLNSDRWMT